MSNVEVTTGGKVILRRCVLSESVCHGINLLREATAIVEDCTIRGNKFHGTREPFFFVWLVAGFDAAPEVDLRFFRDSLCQQRTPLQRHEDIQEREMWYAVMTGLRQATSNLLQRYTPG